MLVISLLSSQAVSWLGKERERAGQLRDWGWAVTRIHADFGWPWPGGGAASRADSWHSGQGGASRLVEDNLRQLYIDTGPGTRGDSSGYLSRWIQTIFSIC